MVGDGLSWIWNNPVAKEVGRCPKLLVNLLWGTNHHHHPGYSGSAGQQAAKELSERLTVRMLNIPSYTRWFVRFAGISGASAVALGAYGAHVFYQRDYPAELKQVYETANRYHFLHTLALLGVPLCRQPKLAGSLIVSGTAIFCGTCYFYALTGSKNIRQYTPYGGMLLIVGWLSMVL